MARVDQVDLHGNGLLLPHARRSIALCRPSPYNTLRRPRNTSVSSANLTQEVPVKPALRYLVLLGCLSAAAGAQSKQPPTPAEFGQWETLATQPRGGLSPDGQWIAYGINRSNRNNELRITKLTDGATKTAPFGAQPVFSADSRWIAY